MTLKKEIVALNKQLDAARHEVEEANLTPIEVAQRLKERQMRPVRKIRGDGSQYDRFYDENGRVVSDVEVTPASIATEVLDSTPRRHVTE